ncbi:FAD-dependent oxidoreductase [Streptomyces sp. NPDC048507]|uniref:FAD-dependent oxidoreductase n=1 Tax=Streptomyces sp. NPDC048507 TaxID=3365560 RepID=UPI0037131E0F
MTGPVNGFARVRRRGSADPERIVVVGYGPAAHRLVERLGHHGGAGPVTVLGAEPEPAYNRPLLTHVLDGSLPADALRLPEPPPGTVVRLGVRAVALDRRRRLVHTDDGERHPYDRLVLATGATPLVPGLPWARGADGRLTEGIRALRTLADGTLLDARGTAVAVIGGGVLAVEAALALRRRGRPVTLVHRGPYPLDRHLDPRGGDTLTARLRALDVDVRAGRSVVARAPGALVLDDGSRTDADEVLLCLGARPRVALARSAGLAVRTGVLVDHRLRTSAARVHALGDCAEPLDATEPAGRVPAGGFAAAWDQAETLAVLLTGGRVRPDGSRRVLRLKAEELDLMRVGTPEGAEETVVLGDAGRGRYARLSLAGGRLTGAELIGLGRAAADVVRLHERGGTVPADRLALLLGGPPGYAAGPPPGTALVCHCNNVTGDALAAAWRAGARTGEALAAATRAGTGCGGCRDEVRDQCAAWAAEAETGTGAEPRTGTAAAEEAEQAEQAEARAGATAAGRPREAGQR